MTLFIPVCDQSTWLHNELRFALRSWEAYGNIETILIIGHKPDWLANVHHIPYEDNRGPKLQNIFNKVKIAAQHYPEFIFGNDDHYLLEPLTELPYYYSCKLNQFKGSAGDTFFRYVAETTRLFPQGNFYDIHCPMICKKDVIDKLTWKKDILFKSYYCNTAWVEGVQMNDNMIRDSGIRREGVERFIIGKKFLASSEAISYDLKKYLLERFPQKSKFEL